MGRRFYEHTLPKLIRSLNRVAKAFEQYSAAVETEKIMSILGLPEHLKRTIKALYKLDGKGTATDVSKWTGKTRAVESGYLNQLVTMKLVRKERINKHITFILDL